MNVLEPLPHASVRVPIKEILIPSPGVGSHSANGLALPPDPQFVFDQPSWWMMPRLSITKFQFISLQI